MIFYTFLSFKHILLRTMQHEPLSECLHAGWANKEELFAFNNIIKYF